METGEAVFRIHDPVRYIGQAGKYGLTTSGSTGCIEGDRGSGQFEVEFYHRDGTVCLRAILDGLELEKLRCHPIDLLGGRSFRIWHYTVSLSSLLVRSQIDGTFRTNVDIFFHSVCHVSGPTSLGAITISCSAGEALAALRANWKDDRLHAWTLHSASGDLTITAIAMALEENNLDLFELPW